MTRTAVCRCGGCSIRVEGEPIFNLLCHCNSCKRRTGGPCGWTVGFRLDQIRDRRGQCSLYHSEGIVGRAENSFCSKCGTTLLFIPEAMPEVIGIAGGCFGDDPPGEPAVSASDDLRCSWLHLPAGWTVRSSAAQG